MSQDIARAIRKEFTENNPLPVTGSGSSSGGTSTEANQQLEIAELEKLTTAIGSKDDTEAFFTGPASSAIALLKGIMREQEESQARLFSLFNKSVEILATLTSVTESLLFLRQVESTYIFTLNSENLSIIYDVVRAYGVTLFYNTVILNDASVSLIVEGSNGAIYDSLFDNNGSILITTTGIGSVKDESTNLNHLRITLEGDAVINCELKIKAYVTPQS